MASGLVSFAFGTVLIYGIGFAEGGLFTDAPIWEPHWPPVHIAGGGICLSG